MSSVLEEMRAVLEGDEEALLHYGTKRHSGRYPYGSGGDPYQHEGDFLSRIERLKKEEGFKETAEEVKKYFDMKLEDYRNEKHWATFTRDEERIVKAKHMKEKGMGWTAIGKELGVPESTVRTWLTNPNALTKKYAAKSVADFLKEQVDNGGMLDVGAGTELFINITDDTGKKLGISAEKLNTALYALEAEGYKVYEHRVPNPTNPGKFTTNVTLCPPDTPYSDMYNKRDQIRSLDDYKYEENIDGFKKKFTYPASLDSSRLKVLLADEVSTDGYLSKEKDGIIELRRGVEDLDLQGDRYSQVRILVDGTHYLKGMAVYSDNMPDGVDVVFNTSKTEMSKALKAIKEGEENPFGTTIKDADEGGQYWYKDSKTGEEKLGLINKKSTEGDWSEWSDNLPSQFLSKQSKALAEQQLGLAIKDRKDEFDSIMAIDNPTIKKHFLNSFADDCDGAAVNLKAAAMPGQKYHVIVPINNQKDTEIYAPNYPDGTKLALVRYPHGGIFEIPVVTVNNKNAMAKKLLGADAPDVVGITSKVAEQLSGADYDGDTVMCIPTDYGKTRISRSEPLKDLVGFDNKLEYGTQKRVRIDKDGNEVEEYFNSRGEKVPIMTKKMVGRQMGEISNLITDMTLDGGATESELARAVKHSMVVIDAEKHKLDYKRSEVENNIQALKERYQRSVREDGTIHVGGASTIISKAKGVEYVNKRRGQARIDPQTGELTYLDALPSDLYYAKSKFDKKTNTQTYYTTDGQKIVFNKSDREAYKKYNPVVKVDKKTGEVRVTNKDGDIEYEFETRTQKSTKMAETKDAYRLLSDARHPIELVYADYANTMKAMANQARKEMLAAGNLKHDPQATKIYQSEVDGLMARLNEVEKNRVRMREADRLTDAEIKRRVKEYEENGKEVDAKTLRKWKQQGVTKHRQEVGAQTRKERNINISDREWEAIQAGAISENKLKRILANSDMDALRDRATPREKRALSDSKINRIRTMNLSGKYTLAEIAAQLGVSTTTVKKYLKGVE